MKLLVGLLLASLALAQQRQPNIVVIVADDLGYGELSIQGNAEIPTPNIDLIAHGGVRFTNGYVTAPNCSPSRAGILTGRYGTRFGHEFNPIGAGNVEPNAGLPLTETLFPQLLHDSGYATSLVGKWHLGGTAPYHPQRRGFDDFYGFLHEGHFFVPPPWNGVTTMLRRRALPGGEQGRKQFGSVVYSTHMGHDEPPYDADNPIVRNSQPVAEETYRRDHPGGHRPDRGSQRASLLLDGRLQRRTQPAARRRRLYAAGRVYRRHPTAHLRRDARQPRRRRRRNPYGDS